MSDAFDNRRSFVFGVAVDDYNFTDREQETQQLRGNFEAGINTILISPRRWGKTSLVKKAAGLVDRERIIVVRMDMFACKTEYDFYNVFSSALLTQTASRKELWMESARDFVSRLVPKISFSPDPNSDISLSLGITPRHTFSRGDSQPAGTYCPAERQTDRGMYRRISTDRRVCRHPDCAETDENSMAAPATDQLLPLWKQETPHDKPFRTTEQTVLSIRADDVSRKDTY